ncbi:MAG: methyltransferase domain-containing protein [Mucilaginibacter sp.]
MKKKLYRLLPFIPKVNLFIGQTFYAFNIKLTRPSVIKKLVNVNGAYANIGCGDAGILAPYWINIDLGKYPTVTHTFDCRKELPFADNTLKGIYTEHFFEHLDYTNEAQYFLQHCYRSLQKDGILRIIVPDAERYLIGYVKDGWDYLKQLRPLDDDLNDMLMGIHYETKMQLVNEVFRQGKEHKFAWDFETMKLCLEKAGFTKVYKMSYNTSNDTMMQIDQKVRQPESLYVEAKK